jgi:hypothetical protein
MFPLFCSMLADFLQLYGRQMYKLSVCLIYSSIREEKKAYRIFVGELLQNGQLQGSEGGRRIRL